MVQKLTVIAIIGLTGSAICMGAAAAIGGGSLGDLEGMFTSGEHCSRIDGATATTRDLDWDGSDKVNLVVYSDANYTPGTDSKLHASGDPQVLAHLRIENGKIDLDCRGWRDRQDQAHSAGTGVPQIRHCRAQRSDFGSCQSGDFAS